MQVNYLIGDSVVSKLYNGGVRIVSLDRFNRSNKNPQNIPVYITFGSYIKDQVVLRKLLVETLAFEDIPTHVENFQIRN